MNERIRELAEQAHSYACEYAQQPDYNPHSPYNQAMYKQRYDEKFTELVVQECIEVAYKAYFANPTTVRGRQIEEKIREHFGIEE